MQPPPPPVYNAPPYGMPPAYKTAAPLPRVEREFALEQGAERGVAYSVSFWFSLVTLLFSILAIILVVYHVAALAHWAIVNSSHGFGGWWRPYGAGIAGFSFATISSALGIPTLILGIVEKHRKKIGNAVFLFSLIMFILSSAVFALGFVGIIY
jgi:hypothetical protein